MIISTPTKFKRKRKVTAKQRSDKAQTDYINAKWAATDTKGTPASAQYKLAIPDNFVTEHIPSNTSSFSDTSKKAPSVYSGDQMIGITVLHKSCLQPVFSKQQAEDAAQMRR
jgi:hypothetical protein